MNKKTKFGLSLLSLILLASCHTNNSNASSSATEPASPSQRVTEPQPTEKPTTKPTDESSSNSEEPSETTKPSVSVTEEFAITVDAGEGATITGLPAKAKEGETVSFTVTLAAEKELSYVTIDGENTLDSNEQGVYSFVRPKHALTVSAITQDKRYNNTVTQVEGATVALSSTYAKKGEKIDVRVTISDPAKSTPSVKVDGTDVEMAITGDEGRKTFTGSFTQPGKDVSVAVTLNDAPAAPAKYAIEDLTGDGVIVKGPSSAAKGEKVTFVLGLEEGYEFSGDVKVYKKGEEATLVDVTKEEDGSYSFTRPDYPVVITRETSASIFQINVEGEVGKLGKENVTVPEYAVYNTKVTLTVKGNETYDVGNILVDGQPATKEEDGSYSFTRPSHAVTLKVVSAVHYYPVKLVNSDHVTLSAYTYDEKTKTYSPIAKEGIRFSDHLYIKATVNNPEGEEYAVDTVKVRNEQGGKASDRTLNADGYYEFGSQTISSDFGLEVVVTEDKVLLAADSPLVGTHAGFKKGYGGLTDGKLILSRFGKGYFDDAAVTRQNYDSSAKTFELKKGTDTYKAGYFDSGLIYVNTGTSSFALDKIYFYLSNASSLKTKAVLLDGGTSLYSSTRMLIEIGDGNKTVYALVNKTDESVKSVSLNLKQGQGITSTGAVFELKEGETSLGYYQNKDGKLVSYNPVQGTFSSDLGSVTLDGFGKATIAKDGASKDATYVVDSTGTYISLKFEEKYYFYSVDKDKKTFAAINYVIGDFYGRKLGTTSSSEWHLLPDFTSKTSATSSYIATGSFKDGKFVSSGRTLLSISPDKKAIVIDYDYYGDGDIIVLSSEPENNSSSQIKFSSVGDKTAFVASISGKKENSVVSSVYFDGKDYHWGTISNADFATAGTAFTFTDNDKKVYNLVNKDGKVVASDGLNGTYAFGGTEAGLGELVIDGDGTGTLNKTAITYTLNEDKTLTVTRGEKTYIITLDSAKKTYTYTEKTSPAEENPTEVTVPAWLAGKTFFGEEAAQSYDEDGGYYYENVGIVFAKDKMTLSTSAGYGISKEKPLAGGYRKNTDVPYTIEEASLKATLNGVEVSIGLDEKNNTFHFEKANEVDGLTLMRSAKFTLVE